MPTTKQRIRSAFTALRKQGLVARMNFWCCQSCGTSAIGNDYPDRRGYVFYHKQDADALDEDGELREGDRLHLAFGGVATRTSEQTITIGHEVVAALKDKGLHVEWNGSSFRRIAVVGRDGV